MKNKYIKVTHISERKTREIIRLFSMDIEAKKASELTGISRPTINKFYKVIRERIAALCEAESPFENGEVELDESFFGARRVRGKRKAKHPSSECSSGGIKYIHKLSNIVRSKS